MTRNTQNTRLIAVTIAAALASTALTGCTTAKGAHANVSAGRAESAMESGKIDKAVEHAERAVLSEPQNASYRAVLGDAYLNAGRFASAATAFDDAMALGDSTPRTALSLTLAHIGAGNSRAAVAVLDDWRDQIEPADLGLAYALAGEAERGVNVLSNALRGGENTAKMRQNLAYAYALAGRWREARVMAMQDVPADQINDRISQWATNIYAGGEKQRVAALLDVPAGRNDPGMPSQLALNSAPATEDLGAEDSVTAPVASDASYRSAAAGGELPALGEPAPGRKAHETASLEQPSGFEAAFVSAAPSGATPAAMIGDTVRFVSEPVVQKLPARFIATPEGTYASGLGGSHLVQLGSFYSEEGAQRARNIYAQRHPGLAGHKLEISEAVVGGKHYWRVSATGFDKAGARSLCASVKTKGQGCIPYSADKPLPGAVS